MHGPISKEIQKLNTEDRQTFRRWLWGMVLVLIFLACGLVVMEGAITFEQRHAIFEQSGTFP